LELEVDLGGIQQGRVDHRGRVGDRAPDLLSNVDILSKGVRNLNDASAFQRLRPDLAVVFRVQLVGLVDEIAHAIDTILVKVGEHVDDGISSFLGSMQRDDALAGLSEPIVREL
jgi:hypothetical protein